MNLADLNRATALVQRQKELEELKTRTLAKEPSFLESGKAAPIGLREISDEQLKSLQAALRETTAEFFNGEIAKILDELEALGIETGRE